MPSYTVPFITAVRDAIIAAWPEVEANGIYHVAEIARIPFEDKVRDNEMPLCVMSFNFQPTGEWGMTNVSDAGQMTLYYVAEQPVGIEDHMIPKLEALRNRLINVELTTGQVIGFPALNWSEELFVNQFFINNARPFVAGAVVAEVTVGVTQ